MCQNDSWTLYKLTRELNHIQGSRLISVFLQHTTTDVMDIKKEQQFGTEESN